MNSTSKAIQSIIRDYNIDKPNDIFDICFLVKYNILYNVLKYYDVKSIKYIIKLFDNYYINKISDCKIPDYVFDNLNNHLIKKFINLYSPKLKEHWLTYAICYDNIYIIKHLLKDEIVIAEEILYYYYYIYHMGISVKPLKYLNYKYKQPFIKNHNLLFCLFI